MRKFILALLLLPVLALHAQVSETLIPYRQGSKWGYASLDKTIAIPATFDGAALFVDDYAIVVRDKQWALIDQNGKEKIPFGKNPILRLTAETVLIAKEVREAEVEFTAVDIRSGKTVSPPCKSIQTKMGMLIAARKDRFGVLDPSGKVIIPFKHRWIDATTDGLWEVRDGENFALFRPDGGPLTEFRYMVVDNYQDNRAKMRVGDQFGFLDRKGQELIPPKYDMVYPFANGYAVVEENGKFGLIDTTGKFVISPHHDVLKDLHLGVASARRGLLWGLVDIQDKGITDFEFNEIVREPYGVIAVRKDTKWAIIGPDGHILGGFIYDSVKLLGVDNDLFGTFDSHKIDEDRGYAVVSQNDKFGVVDAKGKLVLQTKFDDIHPFTNGVALVRQGGNWAVADTAGLLLTDLAYDKLQVSQHHGSSLKNFGIILYYKYMTGWGLMSKSGIEITPPAYMDIETAEDNFYIVTINGKKGVIDATGKIVLPIKYDRIKLQSQSPETPFQGVIFLNDLCTVVYDGKPGYVSKAGVEYFE